MRKRSDTLPLIFQTRKYRHRVYAWIYCQSEFLRSDFIVSSKLYSKEGGIDEEGEAEKRAWIWNDVRGTSFASFSSLSLSFFTFFHAISLNIVTIHLENEISAFVITNEQIFVEARRQWISFYSPLVFFYRRKRIIVRNVEGGPLRSWRNLRNDKRWKKVSYNARCSPERRLSSYVCFRARNCIRIFERVLMAHLPIYCPRPGAWLYGS